MIFSNNNVITALVYSDPPETTWLLIAVHGPPYLAKRKKFRELMEYLIDCFSGHWLVIGDLNSTASNLDKSGGNQKGECSSRSFRNFVDNVGAIDMGFSGPKYTWTNKRSGWANIRSKLDRGICNSDWLSLFPKTGVRHLTAHNSDHNPIILDTHLESSKGVRPFQFEAMWVRDPSSHEVVENAWYDPLEGAHDMVLAKKFQKFRKGFIVWNKQVFGFSKARIKEIESKIGQIQDLPSTKENLELEASLHLEANAWMKREEIKWKQKSRELWLKEGDRNSKFFHLSTLIRRRRNFIAEIHLDNGHWIHSRDDIKAYFKDEFQKLFSSSNPQIPPLLECLTTPSITELENTELIKIPEPTEIRETIWEMHPLKVPSPDGLPGIFFKQYWPTIGPQVVAAIQSFFR